MLKGRGYGDVYDMTTHEPSRKFFEGTGGWLRTVADGQGLQSCKERGRAHS